MFSIATYAQRREILSSKIDSGVILLLGNEESGMNCAANVYPFRQDSSFLYYFGIDQPGLAAIIDIDENKTIIFGNELTIDDIIWVGQQASIKELASQSGVEIVKDFTEIDAYLKATKAASRSIHFLPPYRAENKTKLQNWLGVTPSKSANKASISLIKAIVSQREIKSEEEIQEIKKAVKITNRMHLQAMKLTMAGISEAEVAAAVHRVALAEGTRLSFPIILSVNGEILHNHHHDNIMQEGQLVLVDAGAESKMHYAGDMTRTFPVSGRFSSIQKAIYTIVLNTLNSCIAMAEDGAKFIDLHMHGAKTITSGLKELGLMKGNVEDAVTQGAHALFFPHGLGHQMGLDVHDMEDFGEQHVGYDDVTPKDTSLFGLKFLRMGKTLRAGHVVTIEPGIYFIPELIDLWHSQKKFEDFINYDEVLKFKDFGGIRIEDDILITASGSMVLGDQIPKTIDEIEDFMNKK